MKRALATALALSLALTWVTPSPASADTDWTSKVDASVLGAATAGPAQFIAYMQAHADLSGAASLPTKAEKGRVVYDALTSTASASQAGLLSQLAGLGAPSRSFWISNAVLVTGDLAVLQAVASRTDVAAVYAVGRGTLEPPPDLPGGTESAELAETVGPSLVSVRADQVWALGYRGQGAVVAGADTGVRWTHGALKRQYRGWDAATATADHSYNWHDAIKNPNAQCLTVGGSPQPCDDDQVFGGGHGTHTMGTMVGDDGGANQIGMAPDAKWIACRNMNNGLGVVPTYMECMQWFIAPTDSSGANADPSKAPDVVNNSWGCVEVCAPPLLKDSIDASRAAGIFYAVSAGNDGENDATGCNTVAFPLSVYDSAFTVGATAATTNAIASFSSRGPVLTNALEGVQRKPDIVAPGVGIRSALRGSDTAYGSLSGTSMAGPHVAGLVALIISANPSLRGKVDAIEDVIRRTAVPLTTTQGCGGDSTTSVPNNTFGWGRIDALAAVQLAASTASPEPTGPDPLGVGVPAQVVDSQHETLEQTHPTADYTGSEVRSGTTRWRVVKDTGNCCENHLTTSRDGRLFDIGGRYVNYTDDRGLTWHSVRPLDPLVNAEGSMAMAPNGDVIAMTWDAYTGDRFVAYKYDALTGKWSTLLNVLHQPVYDRPWLTVVPGPLTVGEKSVPYVSFVVGGTGVKDPIYMSTDGLNYANVSSLVLDGLSDVPVRDHFPIAADASFDWIQPIRSATITGLGAGYALRNGGWQLDPETQSWREWRLPDGSVPPTFIQIDSAGRIHHVRSAGTGAMEYRISSDGARSWTSTIVPLPFGGLVDFKVNYAVGIGAVGLRISNQDWVYKFDVTTDTAKLARRYRVGLGDNPAGVGIGQLTNPRMDFQTIAIFPDGRVAVSFLDSTTFSHPPGTGMLGRITPAVAIELDTALPELAAAGTAATGGGWLASSDGGKINFGFQVEQTSTGPTGDLQLSDRGAGVKIRMTSVTSLHDVNGACGSVPDADTSLQIRGSGTFNGAAATFRACVQDNGDGKEARTDLFYLECTSGCAYATGPRAADDALDAGNVDVAKAASGTAPAAEPSGPSTLILAPLLLSDAPPGSLQTLTVRAFGADQRPLSNVTVSLGVVSALGAQTLTAVTDLAGAATLVVTALAVPAEYVATAGGATSNAIELSPTLSP